MIYFIIVNVGLIEKVDHNIILNKRKFVIKLFIHVRTSTLLDCIIKLLDEYHTYHHVANTIIINCES